MAMCLIRAGYELVVCDKRFSALEKFKAIGVSVTEKPANCAQTEMVIIMVGDDSQVEETLLGTNGLLKAVNPQRPPLLAIMSTILPGTASKSRPPIVQTKCSSHGCTCQWDARTAEKGKPPLWQVVKKGT
jgi:3-hydroxyisobutyrate dehydrogenase-like beta-hydroxyacid dehydrogenase